MIHKTLDDFLDNNNDHLICYIVSNFDGFNLVKNCLLSAQKSNVSIVLFALDEEIAEEISKLFEIDIVLFLVGIDKNQTYKYGTFEWIDIVYNRYFIAHRLMKDGRNIVYMDTDVVIMKDFTKNIKRKLRIKIIYRTLIHISIYHKKHLNDSLFNNYILVFFIYSYNYYSINKYV